MVKDVRSGYEGHLPLDNYNIEYSDFNKASLVSLLKQPYTVMDSRF